MEQDTLEEKQHIQEAEYDVPVHWQLGHADALRYRRLSSVIANRAASFVREQGTEKMYLVDLGCGDGAATYQLWHSLHKAGLDVIAHGYDYSEQAIRWALEKTAGLPGTSGSLQFSVGAAENSSYEPSLDRPVIVVMREVIEHLTEEQIDDTLASVRKTFPGASLILTTPSTNSPTDPKHLRHYTTQMLRDTVERNHFQAHEVNGFGFRPRALYPPLVWLKTRLNRRPFLWRFTLPLWSVFPPSWSMTLFATGKAQG